MIKNQLPVDLGYRFTYVHNGSGPSLEPRYELILISIHDGH